MTMIEFMAGLYVGIGLCVGIAFYVSDDPFIDEDSRAIKVLQATIFAIAWLPFTVSVIGPLLLKDGVDWLLGGTTNEQ